MKGRLFREHCDDDGVTVNDFGGAEAGTSLRWIKTNVGRKNLDDAAQNMGGISDGSETTLGCGRGGGSRKLGSESIGGGKEKQLRALAAVMEVQGEAESTPTLQQLVFKLAASVAVLENRLQEQEEDDEM